MISSTVLSLGHFASTACSHPFTSREIDIMISLLSVNVRGHACNGSFAADSYRPIRIRISDVRHDHQSLTTSRDSAALHTATGISTSEAPIESSGPTLNLSTRGFIPTFT